ncbi:MULTISPECIES: hypothetical protein [unclassified Mycolicibacterium]|uniref:hypothetical protein n=1 Tax=unclassified Mycolicibacterium TaxID=2636767 RepID=UPI002ED7A430
MRMAIGVAVVASVLLTTACTGETATPAASPTHPAGTDRQDVLRSVRGVDTCALYGGEQSVAGQSLTVLGPTSVLGCDARIGEPGDKVDVSLGLNVGPATPAKEDSWVKHRTIDGVDVSSTSSLDAPNAPPKDQVVSWSCNFVARYPDATAIMVTVTAPPKIDACPIGEELVRTAIREFAGRPQRGGSDFPTTVLTGADPCASIKRLQPAHRIDWNVPDSGVSTCTFSVDGAELTTSFDYRDPAQLVYDGAQPAIDGHRFVGDIQSGIFEVVVGDEFQVAGKTLQPVVSIVDLAPDMNRIRSVAQVIADEY